MSRIVPQNTNPKQKLPNWMNKDELLKVSNGSSITDKSYNITFRSIAKICDELKCNYGIEQSELVDDILGKIVEIAKSQVSEEHYYPESSHHNNASIYPILSSGSVVSPTQFLLGEAGV